MRVFICQHKNTNKLYTIFTVQYSDKDEGFIFYRDKWGLDISSRIEHLQKDIIYYDYVLYPAYINDEELVIRKYINDLELNILESYNSVEDCINDNIQELI